MNLLKLLVALLLVPAHAMAQDRPPIIDMHLHAVHVDRYGNPPVALCLPLVPHIPPHDPRHDWGDVWTALGKHPPCPDPVWSPTTDDELIEQTIAVLELHNVTGVLSGPPELVRRWIEAAPGRFIPGLMFTLTFEDEETSLESLRQLIQTGAVRVLGEVGNQYAGIAPDDERMQPYWALAEELDIPVAIHLGEGVPGGPYFARPGYRARLSSPFLLEEVLTRHPRLRVYAMHYGSPLVDEMIAMLQAHPQLYVDIGGNQWLYPPAYFYAQLQKFIDAGFGQRIMYGSDNMAWPGVIDYAISVIEDAPFLTDEQKRDIFYNNAARFLRLSGEEVARHSDTAIRGATVVDVASGFVVTDQTILIAGNRIVSVGRTDEVRIAPESDVIDAAGGYLIPGLWDMHVHLVREPEPVGGGVSMATVDWHFPLLLAYGVTGVRNMDDATTDPTLEFTNSVKRRLAEGELVGPRLVAAGPFVDGDPPLGPGAVVATTAAEARRVVDRLADAGADFIKPYENLSREAYFALMDQARRREIPVDGHVPFRVTAEEAAAAGQRTVVHPEVMAAGCSNDAEAVRERFARVLSDYDSLSEFEQSLVQFRLYRAFYDTRDPAACASTIDAFRRYGVAVTADVVAYHHIVHADEILADTASMMLVPPAVRRDWEERVGGERFREFQSILRPIVPLELENVRLLRDAGVTLLAGTDVGVPLQVPGISLHRQLVRLTEAGLTPLDALQSATINPARVLGMTDSLGSIEAGKLADLVLPDANPLEDISNTRRIRAVVADGRLYRRADLDRVLAETKALNQRVESGE
jgi:uncharacterized protein